MWHESRKQERMVRGMLIDYQKRAERRKDHYEKLKSDPLQLLRVTGTPSKLHLNPSASRNEYSNLVPWQGDPSILISRFDVRAHLDSISESTLEQSFEDANTEPDCNYESYRQLVYNSFKGVSQEKALEEISIDELYPVIKPVQTQKKSSSTKVAIGYQYDASTSTSTPVKNESLTLPQPESDESSPDERLSEIGSNLDLNELDRKQIETLNGIGNEYGICLGHFTTYIKSEVREHQQLREDLYLEKQKALNKAKTGTRRERRANKMELKSRQPDRTFSSTSPLSFACRQSPTYPPPYRDRSGSSSSEEPGNIEYITEFGAVSHSQAKHKNKSRHRMRKPRSHRSRSRSHSHSRHKRSRSRSRDGHRSSYRRRQRRHSSSSRSRSRSPSNIRNYSHSRHSRERRHSSEGSATSLSSGRESDKRPNETPSVPSIMSTEKHPEKPKLTHFEKMQLKMENKISKQLKQDQKADRAKMRAKVAEQEDREDDIRDQVLKWRRRERERDIDEEYPY